MMGFFKRFVEWQNYVHYILLGVIVSLVASYYGATIDGRMFFILLVALFVGDTLVHGLFYVLPKGLRWRD